MKFTKYAMDFPIPHFALQLFLHFYTVFSHSYCFSGNNEHRCLESQEQHAVVDCTHKCHLMTFFFCLLKKLKTYSSLGQSVGFFLWGFEKKPKLCILCLWDWDLRYIAEVHLGLRLHFSQQSQLYLKNKWLTMTSWHNCSWRSCINLPHTWKLNLAS